MFVVYLIIFAVLLGLVFFYFLLKTKNIDIWFKSYLLSNKPKSVAGPVHIMFSFVDHYEPMWGGADTDEQRRRVDYWVKHYPKQVSSYVDADGKNPQHTFFYPAEEYKFEYLEKISNLCKKGYGEIEIHLHHDDDTEENFLSSMNDFLEILDTKHGVVPKIDGSYRFSFIHGNWALDNSRKDGRWCGLNNELILLKKLGCYADFTLPSAPSDTQTSKVNSIYYATDNPSKPKSHNKGTDVEVGGKKSGDLMIIQGPLALNFKQRKFGLLPKIENSDIRHAYLPTNDRVDLWVDQHIHVKGKPEWVFIKIHTHGTQNKDMETVLGNEVSSMYEYLQSKYNDGEKHVLHYVTAREMYNIVKAAEAGEKGNPGTFRDYNIPSPFSA